MDLNNDLIIPLPQPIGSLGLVALPGCESLALRINDFLIDWKKGTTDEYFYQKANIQDSYIIPTCFLRYGTGEGRCSIEGDIDNYDIYILCDIFNYNVKYHMRGYLVPMSPDDHYANLKRAISAIGGRAKRITVIMPILYEGRESFEYDLQSSGCRDMLWDLYYNLGIDSIITYDVHNLDVKAYIPNKQFFNYQPFYEMTRALLKDQENLMIDKDKLIVVCPESDVASRGAYYSKYLDLNLGILYSVRDSTGYFNRNPAIVDIRLSGEIKNGQDVILVVDMISDNEVIVEYASKLKENGADKIFVFATFGLFDETVDEFDKAYSEGLINKIFCTNLTYINREAETREWYEEVRMEKSLAFLIYNHNHNNSVEPLLNPKEKIIALFERYNKK